jgi:hypothetical protein
MARQESSARQKYRWPRWKLAMSVFQQEGKEREMLSCVHAFTRGAILANGKTAMPGETTATGMIVGATIEDRAGCGA